MVGATDEYIRNSILPPKFFCPYLVTKFYDIHAPSFSRKQSTSTPPPYAVDAPG